MSERSDQKRPLPPAILADALPDRPSMPSPDVSAQAFREAAAATYWRTHTGRLIELDTQIKTLLLAAAEQREQLDILQGSVAGQSDFIRQMGREHQQQLSAALAIVDGFDMARPDDHEGGRLNNLRNILTGARETKLVSNTPAIFLCQVCDQTPERGHAPDCPGWVADGGTRLHVTATEEEAAWVHDAAALHHLTTEEFIKRAINGRLRRQGVDAVLFRESDDE